MRKNGTTCLTLLDSGAEALICAPPGGTCDFQVIFYLRDLRLYRDDGALQPLIKNPDDRSGQDQAVDAVEHSAVAGEQRAGVFYRRATFVSGLDQVAGLPRDIRGGGDSDEGQRIDLHPAREGDGH